MQLTLLQATLRAVLKARAEENFLKVSTITLCISLICAFF
jgi:hypothetical protein